MIFSNDKHRSSIEYLRQLAVDGGLVSLDDIAGRGRADGDKPPVSGEDTPSVKD